MFEIGRCEEVQSSIFWAQRRCYMPYNEAALECVGGSRDLHLILRVVALHTCVTRTSLTTVSL